MNGTFVSPPSAAFDPERVRARWAPMTLAERSDFVRAIGPRASVREFGLSPVEVALAWRTSLPLESRLAHVAMLARD